MEISSLSQLFFSCTLSIFYITSFTDVVYSQCLHDQKTLLFEFKAELKFNSSYSRKLVHWNPNEDCCSWKGVECDGAGHVISLELDDEGISGRIENSSTLFSLKYLKKLNLAYNNFSGVQIPKRIHNLTHLTHLNLSYARFGGQFPIEISLMRRVVSLDLSSTFIDYLEIPNLSMLIQNLTRLRELYLDNVEISSQRTEWCEIISSSLPDLRKLSLRNCNISGPLDHSLSKLRSLSVLRLDYNNLSTTVPNFFANFSKGTFPEMIFQVPTLETLDLSDNMLLSGTIPQLHQIGSFRTIVLASTNFAGSLPDSISNLTMLSYMDLSRCKFTGPIPSSLVNLKELRYMDLRSNNLTGSLSSMYFDGDSNLFYVNLWNNSISGEIPQSLFRLPLLQQLILSNNKFSGQITGEIPSWIWDIGKLQFLNLSFNLLLDLEKPYHFPSDLYLLDLHSNLLRGELPLPPAGALYVDYSNNNFEKSIPHDIGSSISFVSFLSLANNNFSGAIPTSFCNATRLEVLDLSNNNLSGGIPRCLVNNIHNLEVLNLGRNNISGNIPDTFPISCSLNTLDLSENNLSGNIPLSLANCKSLEVLNVGNNNINDSFPCMLSSNLHILVLRSNRFHGEVRCHESWPYLQIIDIASNNFSGYLYPRSFLSWGAMMRDNDAQLSLNYLQFVSLSWNNMYYQNKVRVTFKGLEMELVKILMAFKIIDFSCNNFQGEILDAIGDLNFLYVLNLSHNNLIGKIPKSVGNLTQLESLDLSMNQLTGEIPGELAGLTFLSVLNLSYNKLAGMIPKGRQLQTFSAASFDGNIGLCDLPLNRSCNNNKERSGASPKFKNEQWHKKNEIHWEYVSVALGFVVGLGSYLWLLWCCQSLRQKIFYKIDNVLAKVFDPQDRRKRHGRRLVRDQVIRRG
ncbi:Leucine-rich repeat protein [Handroanthus impetiginosus]|uniref:Leucine-rich repeat protein n=1 Tax=Handroanthus impetiginosus TaxID=429701 RepID=A0A2G9HHD4_9LAMI|nr:Leucine-rich repeat protein [Handroanthus impetiginosus]